MQRIVFADNVAFGALASDLGLIDGLEAQGHDPARVPPDYWRMVHNCLAAHMPPPVYTPERHAAFCAREAVR